MDTKLFYERLKENARNDFDEIITNSNFIDGDRVELSEKITIAKTMLDYVLDELENGGTDIVALLYHDKPITAFYDWYKVKELSLLENLEVEISNFTVSTKIDIQVAFEEPKYYSQSSVEKAREYQKFAASMEIDSAFEQVEGYVVENKHSNIEDSMKERYTLLQQSVENNYGIILSNTHIQDGYTEEFAEKIIFCKMFKEYIEEDILSDDSFKIETLLFLTHPLTAFYEYFEHESPNLIGNFKTMPTEFIDDMLGEILKMHREPQWFSESEVERANVAIGWIDKHKSLTESLEQVQDDVVSEASERLKYRSEYNANIINDYISCIKLSQDVDIQDRDTVLLAKLAEFRDYMLKFDNLSLLQLQAISKLGEPIALVFAHINVDVRVASESDIDTAIIATADDLIRIYEEQSQNTLNEKHEELTFSFDERYELLKDRVYADYSEIIHDANFMDGDVAELSLKVVLTKEIASYISELEGSYTDIEALLLYERPASAFYNHVIEQEVSILEGIIESINDFIVDGKEQLECIYQNPTAFDDRATKKAVFFIVAREAMINVIENDTEEQDDDMER